MALRTRIHVVCDLCEEPLCWPPDENEDRYSDGRDIRFFDNIAEAESAAVASGWEPVDPNDDHIDRQLRCTGCIGRRRAMREWIKVHRVIDYVSE